ncbi:MAG: hypothetical protein AAGA55_01130 [Planctomycetota bacterium]
MKRLSPLAVVGLAGALIGVGFNDRAVALHPSEDGHNHPAGLETFVAEATTHSQMPSAVYARLNDLSDGIYGKQVVLPTNSGLIPGTVLGGFEYHFGGWYGWGVVDAPSGGFFAYAQKGDSARAIVYTGERITLARKLESSNNSAVRWKLDWSSQMGHVLNLPGYQSVVDQARANRGTPAIVDHLIGYSNQLRQNLGDPDGDGTSGTFDDATTHYMLLVANLNVTYLASGITNLESRLAYAYEADIDGNPGPGSLMPALTNPSDGVMDEMFALRDLVKADLGYASMPYTVNPSGAIADSYNTGSGEWLAIGSVNETTGGLSAHEIGHNLGAVHSRFDTDDSDPHPSVPYAYGYCLPAASVKTLMAGNNCPTASPRIIQYSNPDLIYSPTGEPTGIDHDVDPSNSADVARAIDETAPIISGFRTGTPQFPDCDSDEILDPVEIAHGNDRDDDLNGVPDACQIADDPTLDCNTDGLLDVPQLPTFINGSASQPWSTTSGPSVLEFNREPDSDLVLSVRSNTYRLSSGAPVSNTQIDVLVNGGFVGSLFGASWNNCAINMDSFTVPVGSIPVPTVPGTLEVEFLVTATLNRCLPGPFPTLTFDVDFESISAVDADRDGLIDCNGDESCNLADVVAPFGTLNFLDVAQHNNWYAAQDPKADIAEPLGVWNFFDVAAFLNSYNAGCP